MLEAIFFAVARDPKLPIGIGQLGSAAGFALMERFLVSARLDFEPFPPDGDFFALP